MKKILVLLCFILGAGVAHGQQMMLFSQYMHNPFLLNPAVAGTNNFFQIRLMSRLQWVGFQDAPVSNSLSVYGPVSAKTKDMGYGVTVYSDITSPTSQLGLKGAYAINRALNDHIRYSLGISLGFLQYKYDGTKASLFSNTDPVANAVKTYFKPIGMIGAYVYSNNFQFGFSVDNLWGAKIDAVENTTTAVGRLVQHYYLMGAYTYYFNRRWSMEGSTVFKTINPISLIQWDLNARVIYQKVAWGGLSFRTNDAITVLFGYIFNKRIYVGYSLDINVSDIRPYNFGSHELMIGYRFNSLK